MLLENPKDYQPNAPVVIEMAQPAMKRKYAETIADQPTHREQTLAELMQETLPPVCNFLQAKHPHIYDGQIKFVEETHTYYVSYALNNIFSSEFNTSVSEFYKQFFEPFRADEYIDEQRKEPWYQQQYGDMTNQEIQAIWEENRLKASKQGTFFHSLFEMSCNGFPLAQSKYKHLEPVKQFLKWRKECFDPYFEFFRSELRMFSDETYRLVGTIDALVIRKAHKTSQETHGVLTLGIFDWKNSKNIKTRNQKNVFGLNCCSTLMDCNFNHYALQQNLYKYLLEHYYHTWTIDGLGTFHTVKVEFCKLVVVHDNHRDHSAHVYDMPNLTHIVEKMLLKRKVDLEQKMNLRQLCENY